MEWLGTSPIPGPDIGASAEQFSCHLSVVTEGSRVQGRVPFVDLDQAIGKEELVNTRQGGGRQGRVSVEETSRRMVVERADQDEQARQIA
jgi:hypothetical protein